MAYPRLIVLFFISLILSACSDPAPSSQVVNPALSTDQSPVALIEASDESARLNLWFDEKNEQRLRFSPMELTSLGRKELYDQIDDLSEAGAKAYVEWFTGSVAELKAQFAYDQLDFETKTSYDLWVYTAEQSAANLQWRDNDYVFNQMNGAHVDLPTFLISYHTVDTLADMQAYISRVSGIGRAIRQGLEQAQANAALGVRPPRFAYDAVIAESGKLVTGLPFQTEAAEDAALFADGKGKIAALVQAGTITQARADELMMALEAALIDDFAPAYQALIDWFKADLPNSEVIAKGAWSLPDGAAYYAHALANSTTLPLSPEQVHATGLAEVARIKIKMQQLKEQMGFDGDMPALVSFLKTDERFFYPNTDVGRQQYLDDSTAYLERITARLPEFFGTLPKAPLVVRRVEAFREKDGAAQHYYAGSPDGSRAGIYYVHLSDTRTMPKTEMESIAYHEGLPGHHMQISIAQELTTLPAFRGQFFYGAYVEGWALYAEQLAGEMGAYSDPYLDFGHLTSEMWRAIRLVVDTGMHSMKWTEQDAIDYFAANASTPLPTITSEVRRYLVWPGQATSYMTGMLKIMELRERAQQQLGANFDIREFHDVILGGGALPLAILDKRVDNWLAGK